MKVREVPESCQFVTDSTEVDHLNRQIDGGASFDSFFVEVGDGEYTRVYGMYGIVPHNDRTVYSKYLLSSRGFVSGHKSKGEK